MIKVGQKVRFDPWHGIHSMLGTRVGETVEGYVIYVNPEHSYFTVEYELGDKNFKSSFNFCDVFGRDAYVRPVRR